MSQTNCNVQSSSLYFHFIVCKTLQNHTNSNKKSSNAHTLIYCNEEYFNTELNLKKI